MTSLSLSLSMLMSNQGAARIEKLTDAKLTTGVAAAWLQRESFDMTTIANKPATANITSCLFFKMKNSKAPNISMDILSRKKTEISHTLTSLLESCFTPKSDVIRLTEN